MSRRNRGHRGPQPGDFIKIVVGGLLLLSVAVGGASGFVHVFVGLALLLILAVVIAAISGLAWLGWKAYRRHQATPDPFDFPPLTSPTLATPWSVQDISDAMERLDWYQFEKVNAAILQLEGWSVQRRGGAAPDGGVDLIAQRNGEKKIVQCKHWLTWKVQEKVVRELLGSMTHMHVSSAALHAIGGYTAPAAALAAQHGIQLSDRAELASRARAVFSDEDLNHWFTNPPRCCPKCDGEMILRTGNFDSFYGCRKFPRCRGKINVRASALFSVE